MVRNARACLCDIFSYELGSSRSTFKEIHAGNPSRCTDEKGLAWLWVSVRNPLAKLKCSRLSSKSGSYRSTLGSGARCFIRGTWPWRRCWTTSRPSPSSCSRCWHSHTECLKRTNQQRLFHSGLCFCQPPSASASTSDTFTTCLSASGICAQVNPESEKTDWF